MFQLAVIPERKGKTLHDRNGYRVAQKSKPLQIIKKSYNIVFNPVNEIRFIRQIKV